MPSGAPSDKVNSRAGLLFSLFGLLGQDGLYRVGTPRGSKDPTSTKRDTIVEHET